MFEVKSDHQKNRLYITIGKGNENDIRGLVKDIAKNVATLEEGFSCLVDIREMDIKFSEKEVFTMELIMGGLVDAEMGRVVRVVSKSNKIPQMKMEKESRSMGYRARPASTIEEAERILDEKLDR